MNDNDRIAQEIENERLRMEQEKLKPARISDKQVKEAKYAWMVGTVGIDILTAWLMWTMTGYWYYALVWAIAGAGGLLWSERQKERIGNNDEQKILAKRGKNVSAFAVFGMALVIGFVWVTKMQGNWINATIELTSLFLFFFHLYQAHEFHEKDDEQEAMNEEARNEAKANSEIRAAHRANRKVESKKNRDDIQGVYRQRHGAAFDAALGLSNPRPSATMTVMQTAPAVRQVVQKQPQQIIKQYTLAEFLDVIDQTAESARAMLKQYNLTNASDAWKALRDYGVLPPDLTHKNFDMLFAELMGTNPTPARPHQD